MTPYEILELQPGASKEEIKKAFHRLAHIHHPDKGGDAEKFKKISAAYAELKDLPEYVPQAYQNPNDTTHYNPITVDQHNVFVFFNGSAWAA